MSDGIVEEAASWRQVKVSNYPEGDGPDVAIIWQAEKEEKVTRWGETQVSLKLFFPSQGSQMDKSYIDEFKKNKNIFFSKLFLAGSLPPWQLIFNTSGFVRQQTQTVTCEDFYFI